MDKSDTEIIFGELRHLLSAMKITKLEKLDMILESTGGEAEAAYKLALLIRGICKEFNVLILNKAKSGATLFSLCADKIWMSPVSELGPIDPIVSHPLRTGLMIPVRAVSYFIEQTLPQISKAAPSVISSFLPIDYGHVGFCGLALNEAEDYARRLLNSYQFHGERRKVDEVVERLIRGYPSHRFPILFEEAKNIGLKVEQIPEDQLEPIEQMSEEYRGELEEALLIIETSERKRSIPKERIRWL